MKELFRERDPARVGYYQSLLDEEGIPTHVRNRDLVTLMGTEVPIPEFFPALCVINDEDYQRAMDFLEEIGENSPPADVPFQMKGIVVVGVCGLCAIFICYALTLLLSDAAAMADIADETFKRVMASAIILASVAGMWKVLSSYRQTKLRES